jgi:hypothetical protein
LCLMGGMSYSRSNDGADMAVDLYCRHFFKGLYAQGSVSMNTDGNAGVGVALGKMFMWGEHLCLILQHYMLNVDQDTSALPT